MKMKLGGADRFSKKSKLNGKPHQRLSKYVMVNGQNGQVEKVNYA